MPSEQTTADEWDDDPRDWDEEDGDDFDCGLMRGPVIHCHILRTTRHPSSPPFPLAASARPARTKNASGRIARAKCRDGRMLRMPSDQDQTTAFYVGPDPDAPEMFAVLDADGQVFDGPHETAEAAEAARDAAHGLQITLADTDTGFYWIKYADQPEVAFFDAERGEWQCVGSATTYSNITPISARIEEPK